MKPRLGQALPTTNAHQCISYQPTSSTQPVSQPVRTLTNTNYHLLPTSQPAPYGWSSCQLLKNWWLQRPCMGGYMRVRFVFRRGRVASPARQQARQRSQRAAVTRCFVTGYSSPAKCSQLQPPQPAGAAYGAACSQRPPAPCEYLIEHGSRAPVPATHSLIRAPMPAACGPLPVSGFGRPLHCPLPAALRGRQDGYLLKYISFFSKQIPCLKK